LDTLDFHQHINDDFYNLQICTQLLDCLGVTFKCKNGEFNGKIQNDIERIGTEKNRLIILRRTIIRHILRKLARFNKQGFPIIIRGGNFKGKQELRLIFKTLGKVQSITANIASPTDYIVNQAMRNGFKNLVNQREEFNKILNNVLPTSVPLCFAEGYRDLKKKTRKDCPRAPKIIISAGAYHHDELFKVWAAECSEKGTKIIIMQHGGVYGVFSYLQIQDHDLSISDRFYSWGWTLTNYNHKISSSPSACHYRNRLTGNSDRKTKVLLVTTVVYRYLFRLRASDQSVVDYMIWQQKFIEHLNCEIRQKLIVRLHRKEFGWHLGQRLKDMYPDIDTEFWKIPFHQRLQQCRLYVFDNNSTTFLEALALNKPSLLFWNPVTNELHPETACYFDELRAVGILHDTPESAAAAVNSFYDRVEEWWCDPMIQSVRRRFCSNFVKLTDDYTKEWGKELVKLI